MTEKYSFLVRKNGAIALVSKRASGPARYAFSRCEESINSNRKWNLVNAFDARISNAKNLTKTNVEDLYFAEEINDNEFYLTN